MSTRQNKVLKKRNLPLVWNKRVDPREYPDFGNRSVQPVTWEDLDNRFHAMAFRIFHMNDGGICDRYKQEIEWYVKKLGLGDVLWIRWTFIRAKNFREVIRYIAEQKLWLFDIYGYRPGGILSDASCWSAEYSSQVTTAANSHQIITQILGPKFLGWDNGEEDGRYLNHYGRTFCPTAHNKLQAYEHFAGYFHRLGNHLNNYLCALLGLYHAHYMLHLGNQRLIGCESAQCLPSVPPWFAFIRGAGKQYGVLWFGNASIYNRWGFKCYCGSGKDHSGYEFGPDKGTSLSLLKRLWYVHLMYGCCMMGYESDQAIEDNSPGKFKLTITPIGELQVEGIKWQEAHPDLGVQYTPVALLLDFYQGWVPARSAYGGPYVSWGDVPYSRGDHQIDAFFRLVYSGYEDAGFYRDERGFLTDTPTGDIFDVLLSNVSEEILSQYRAVITLGDIVLEGRLLQKVLAFVKNGGNLITWPEHLSKEACQVMGFSSTSGSKITQLRHGKGKILVLGGNLGLVKAPGWTKNEFDKPLPPVYTLNTKERKKLLEELQEYSLVKIE